MTPAASPILSPGDGSVGDGEESAYGSDMASATGGFEDENQEWIRLTEVAVSSGLAGDQSLVHWASSNSLSLELFTQNRFNRFLRKRCFAEFFPVPRSHACLDLSLGLSRKLSHLRGRFGPTYDRETLEALIVIRKCHQTGIFCRNRFFETTKLYCRDVYHSSKLWGFLGNSVT